MNKKDLKYGNIVELRNGDKFIYHAENSCVLMFLNGRGWIPLCEYKDNLKRRDEGSASMSCLDIMKVYEDYTCTKLLWERKEIELTDDEKVILSNIDKKYKYIARDKDGDVTIYDTKPHKVFEIWTNTTFDIGHDNDFICLDCYNHLFEFVKWEDDEPYVIEYLLKYCC